MHVPINVVRSSTISTWYCIYEYRIYLDLSIAPLTVHDDVHVDTRSLGSGLPNRTHSSSMAAGAGRARRRPPTAPVRASRTGLSAAAPPSGGKRRRVDGAAESDDEYDPDTQDGLFFAALREFAGNALGEANQAAVDEPPQPEQPAEQKENEGRRPKRNRKQPDAWWEAKNAKPAAKAAPAEGVPAKAAPAKAARKTKPAAKAAPKSKRVAKAAPATPEGAPPSQRKRSVRRSMGNRRSSGPRASVPMPQAAAVGVAVLNEALTASAGDLGLTLRAATLADVASIVQAHTRFEMEMAAWSPDPDEEPHLADAEDIRDIVTEEGGERIILLTRECGRMCDVLGFAYSFDEEITQSTWSGVSAYIAQVWLASSERGQGLGELLLSAALASSLSRGTVASHLFLCEGNKGARRLYEKAGYNVDGDSGDPVHNLVLVNPGVTSAAVGAMLAARQAKQLANSRTGSRSRRGATAKPAVTIKPAATKPCTVVAPASALSRTASAPAAASDKASGERSKATCSSCSQTFVTASSNAECADCRETTPEEEMNAQCSTCDLSFFTASGKSECVDCRELEEEDSDSPAVTPDVSPADSPEQAQALKQQPATADLELAAGALAAR